MARIRTIKPEFFTSSRIAELSIPARLTFIGMWTECDDFGVCEYSPRVLKGHLWPYDDAISPVDIEGHIAEMLAETPRPLIRVYECDGKRYIEMHGWGNQRINRRSNRKHPAPPGETESSVSPHCVGSESAVSPHQKGPQEQGTGNREQGSGTSFNDTGLTYQGLSTGTGSARLEHPSYSPPPIRLVTDQGAP